MNSVSLIEIVVGKHLSANLNAFCLLLLGWRWHSEVGEGSSLLYIIIYLFAITASFFCSFKLIGKALEVLRSSLNGSILSSVHA